MAQPMYILRKLHGQSSKCQVFILFFNVNGEGHSLISVGISIDMYGIIKSADSFSLSFSISFSLFFF